MVGRDGGGRVGTRGAVANGGGGVLRWVVGDWW